MILAVDISNTTIKLGLFQGDELAFAWQIATERHKAVDDYAMLLLSLFNSRGVDINRITGISISCVVPPLRVRVHPIGEQIFETSGFCRNARCAHRYHVDP